ncbi:PREDICTED: glycerophosphodiester phosphodiesterase GDPD4 isoform X1 [Tarenaya hassleriana]|uniref:glycerophosphodiester phosphodiesterase GDPD4 isoform X1 n=1 Tax=Tarenaya hassleriana TaxID=28532 RepID=UPI00053C9E95|nr:PREDICTED: glycerophosphodiester phosphodiesterase GDPD4 isoform X1 [Tarenaya hassleriana]
MAIARWPPRRRALGGGGTRRVFFRLWYSHRFKRMILFSVAFMAFFPLLFFHLKLRRFSQMIARECDWLHHPPLVCAHGGDSALAFPNTMDAYDYAIRSRVDCIEVDVSRSADGVLFALHHRDLQRITRNSSIQVGDMNMKQIKKLGVSHVSVGNMIPTLEEALKLISHSVRRVILDAKVGAPLYEKGLAQDILSVIERSRCNNCMVWAKSDSLVRDIIRLAPDLTVGYIVMEDPSSGVRNNLLRMRGARVAGVYHPLIDERLMRVMHGRNKKVYAWTVDDADPMRRMLHLGVDAVVTSHPSMFLALMEDRRTQCLEEGFQQLR